MRRFTILASLAVVLALVSPAAVTANHASDTDTVYLALGDSLAWGDGASDPATTAYVPLMADYFAGRPHAGAKQAVNLAVGGETTSSFLAGQVGAAVATILDPTTDVRVVTLSIGGNDLLDLLNEPTDACVGDPGGATCQGQVAVALAGVAANYPTLMGTLAYALAQDPGTEKVFVLTLYNPFGGTLSPYEAYIDTALLGVDMTVDCAALGNPYNAGLNDIVSCSSLGVGAAFAGAGVQVVMVDGFAVVDDQALALTHIGDPGFNIHPNDEGYAAIAKAHRLADQAA